MDYREKIARVEMHLKEHPRDYQSRISLLKLRSSEIEHRRYEKRLERLREVAYYRRKRRDEECACE